MRGNPVTRMPLIVAHMGASYDAPENTLASFRLAWQQGADAIEGDFHLTADGRIVCIHDQTLDRTAGVHAAVAGSTLAELREMDVGSRRGQEWRGERIPTIEEVLATVPAGRKVFIEIKVGPDILTPLRKAIEGSAVAREQIVVIAFDAEVVARAKRELTGTKAMWLVAHARDSEADEWRPTPDQILVALTRSGADGVDSDASPAVDRGLAAALRARRLELHVWTVDDPGTAERLVALGVHSLTTNRPGWLRARLAGIMARDRS